MLKIKASIIKELLVLVRDKAGVVILFLMPMVLIFVMTLIQDSTFRKLDEKRLPVLVLNMDKDLLGNSITDNLSASDFFSLEKEPDGIPLTEEVIQKQVAKGKYQIGIIIPANTTRRMMERANAIAAGAFGENDPAAGDRSGKPSRIIIYFDPVIKNSFKQSIRSALENFARNVEHQLLFDAVTSKFSAVMPGLGDLNFGDQGTIGFEEIYATTRQTEIIPNSVQHNVPAWAVFAMFFIVIPLTGNIIKERESGGKLRLKTMPGNYFTVLISKIIVYLLVCLIQFLLMLIVGLYILPYFGLPMLELGPNKGALAIMAITTALAATGYGILVGTIATSHEQAASFGSVSVIILAAIGGIWVPVFMMPEIMQSLSRLSPLSWGLNGFYAIFLRGGGINDIYLFAGLLTGFFALSMIIAMIYEDRKKSWLL